MRVTCLVVVAVAGLTATPTAAHAHDSLAPAGASHNWLPDEEWVHRHWIPFDERALNVALALGPHELRAYLYNDHHTLADLARRRGVDPRALATRLVAPWPAERRAVLHERTWRILTQGHLAQHVFFHVFHGLEVHSVLGHEYRAMREQGHSYLAIAEHRQIAVSALRDGVVALIDTNHRDGIERLEAWPRESDRVRDRTLAQLGCWLRQPPARLDPANPFGKNRLLHGTHAAGWPRSAHERRIDDRRVERVRQELPNSCWPLPRRWR